MTDHDDRDGYAEPPNDWAPSDDSRSDDATVDPGSLSARPRQASVPGDRLPVRRERDRLDNQDIFAIVIGLFFPGVGQMILGQPKKGLALLIGTYATCGLGGILVFAAMVDTYLCAVASKRRALEEWEFFPDYKDFLK